MFQKTDGIERIKTPSLEHFDLVFLKTHYYRFIPKLALVSSSMQSWQIYFWVLEILEEFHTSKELSGKCVSKSFVEEIPLNKAL